MIFSHSARSVIAFLRASFRWAAPAVLACLAFVSTVANSTAAAAAGGPTILVMGDSISASYGLAQGQGWVDLLQKRLASEGFPHRVVNASISGDTTAGGRTRIGPALQTHRPDIVIVELGGNDGLRGTALGPVRANLEFIVDAIQKAGAQALIVGMQMPPNYGASYVRQFAAVFSDVAKARNTGYVPFLLQGFADKPELFQPDRIHPTAQAQPLMVETIWPELAKLVRRP
jgi:acyl-CoA thioesterase-1